MRALALALIVAMPVAAADVDRVIDAIRKDWKSDHAMEVLNRVYSTDRFFTFPKFEATARFLSEEMRRAGLDRVEVVDAPADGETQIGFWTMPLAWDATAAKLEVLDESVPPDARVLADYQKVPSSLGMWSGSTGPEGVRAELVDVRSADLKRGSGPDLKGKLALLDENPANVKWLLVKAGALGAVNTFTENPTLRDDRQWINAWGDDGWAYTKRSTPLLSYSITPRQADLVRGLIAKGRVWVRATAQTRYYKSAYPYVTGVIPGEAS